MKTKTGCQQNKSTKQTTSSFQNEERQLKECKHQQQH